MDSKENKDMLEKLAAPLPPDCIEWRVQTAAEKNGKIRLLVLPYIESRAVMERLDEVCGVYWQSDFKQIQVNGIEAFQCRISIKIGDEWITRTDAAEISDYESVKGGHSNALKRCGVQWGIGRLLYDLPSMWVDLKERGANRVFGSFKIKGQNRNVRGYFDPPALPEWALPNGTKQFQTQKQAQQQQQKQQKPSQKANTNTQFSNGDKKRAEALTLIKKLIKELALPSKFVNPLFEKASGAKRSIVNASFSDLQKLYQVLHPVHVYVKACKHHGINDEDDMLFYAQTILKERLDSIHSLYFKMTKEVAEETIKLIRQDLKLEAV